MGILDEVAKDGLVVVADEEDFGDLGDSGDGVEAVLDDGLAGDFEEGLLAQPGQTKNQGWARNRINSPWAHPERAGGNEYLCWVLRPVRLR